MVSIQHIKQCRSEAELGACSRLFKYAGKIQLQEMESNGLWASTHALYDEPGHAWQSSVLLAWLRTGCSLLLPSAPALADSLSWPAALFLDIQHAARLTTPHRGHFAQQLVTLLCLNPALPACAFLFTPCSKPGHPQWWLRPHCKWSAQCVGCLSGSTKSL